jgi:hypothetical protein
MKGAFDQGGLMVGQLRVDSVSYLSVRVWEALDGVAD